MYKKEKLHKVLLLSLGWMSRTLAQDARGRDLGLRRNPSLVLFWLSKAFEVAERSEAGALASLPYQDALTPPPYSFSASSTPTSFHKAKSLPSEVLTSSSTCECTVTARNAG